MTAPAQASTVEELNEALRLYRRLLKRLALIVVVGVIAVAVLAQLSMALNPPYGVYIMGEGLATWGLIGLVVAMAAQLWIDGRALGKVLNDPAMKTFPVLAAMTAVTLIATRANAMGMTWTGFFGPLRPLAKR